MNDQFKNMQKLAFGKVLLTENTESSLKNKIKELVHSSLGEAKKKKKKDVAPQNDEIEDLDVNIDDDPSLEIDEPTDDTMAPETSTATDIDPKVKSVQDSLQKAFASAKALGDEKLIQQIGNTITMLVRTQVLGAGQAVAESLQEGESPDEEMVGHYLRLLEDLKMENTDDVYDLQNLLAATKKFLSSLENEVGNINEGEEDFDLDQAFEESPDEHSYEEVLNVIESYEDAGILEEFEEAFEADGKPVRKQEYVNFCEYLIDDISEMAYVKANWVSITDPDVYDKAGLN